MALTITHRIAKHNQMKAKLAEKKSKIRLDDRKARTRHLIEAGGRSQADLGFRRRREWCSLLTL